MNSVSDKWAGFRANDVEIACAPNRNLLSRIVVACMTLLLAPGWGCRPPDLPEEIQKQGGFIAMVGLRAGDPLWPVFEATARRYESTLGGLSLRTAVPSITSPAEQSELLRKMHTPLMRGVCIHPADTVVMADVLENLRANGVAVVTMMTELAPELQFAHSGLDELAMGRELANATLAAVGESGTAAVIQGGEAAPLLRDRFLGFEERIAELPSVTVLRTFDCQANPFVAGRYMREYTERFPRLDVWVSIDNWPLRNLEAGKRLLPTGCGVVTYGPFPEYWQLLNDGTCHALIGADYTRIAESALRMCVTLAQGQPVAMRRYQAAPITWTPENMIDMQVDWFRAIAPPETPTDTSPRP